MANYYPLVLDLTDKECVVIGGGEVACRKVTSLLACQAKVTTVSPALNSQLRDYAINKRIIHIEREYRKEDLKDAFLVIGATDDRSVNVKIANDAKGLGLLVNIVDSPDLSNFLVPASLRRGKLIIGISTSGASPALAKKIRKDLEDIYGEEYATFVDLLGNLRPKVFSRYKEEEERRLLWKRLVESDIPKLIKNGKDTEWKKRIEELISEGL
ncbi:MAG: bifunctional precorrin-2 dehydrogenase/sirohydrochlorin ferrochelatase [bacterium]|nr:bifunctional precorrin-2 dehydrogenase/sirohydrochlorin ferrochelatase [bacterium]